MQPRDRLRNALARDVRKGGRPALVVHVWESQFRHSATVRALASAPGFDLAAVIRDLDEALADAAAQTTQQGVALARNAGLEATGETVEAEVSVWRAIASLARTRSPFRARSTKRLSRPA